MINIESINNYHITNWEWNVFDGDGEELNPELYFTGINLSEEVLLTDISNYNISLDITSLEGCSSSYSISPAVILNQFNPEIVELDDNQCFNGQNQIVKSLGIELNASYPTEYSISSFEWEVYPEAELINMTDSHVYILFEESSNYLVTYRMTVENGTGEDCVYYTQAEYEIGVNANIQAPDIICVGEEFDVTAEVSVGIGANSMFLWSSSDSLQFSSPNNLASTIISNQNYQGDSTEVIVVDFIVTNDNGCWEQTTDSIKVYELVADFIASDAGEICAPVILNFNSLYNNFVSSYEWSYKGVNYLDEEFSYTYPEDTLIYGDFFNEMAIYNIGLVVHSIEGCADTIVKDSLLDIKRPYPYFTLEQNNICDGTEVSIIDSSSYSSNVGLFTQGVFYDSTFYNLEGITNIVYEFPYDLSEELVYHHPVTLNAFLGQCSGSYTDTIVVYPNPQIDIVLSDTLGCPPYTILFGDSVSYADTDQSEFYWEIASQNSNLQMDSVSFNEVGSYSVFHSVLSENNCFSDITLVDTINIYQNPIASYTYTANVFCYGEADVDFENTSFYVTDSIFSLWSVSTSDVFNATEDNPSIHFEETEDVLVTLEIVDEHGCIDDTTQIIEMIVLDTLVSSPNLDFVSVNEYGVSIQWNQIQDDLFDNLSIYHSQNNNNWFEVFNTSDLIPNSFTHVIDVNVVNEYKIVQQDSCGFYSDSSRVHNSILLQANTDNYQNVNLSWTNYVGWDSVDSYRIYRREENGNFSLIAQLNGDVLSYEDVNLCNRFYHYYVLASHNDQEFYSYSNVESLEPLFVDYSIPLDVRYSTVVDHSIITQWEGFYESDMTFYNIDRWDDYFGWVEDYDISSESPYIDNDVGVHHREYIYRISYEDECGNSGPHSNHGTNVLLQGDQFESHIALYWSNYEDWDSGVLSYVLEYRNETTQEFEFVQEFSSETFNYIDSDLSRMGTDTTYCYRLIAKSYDNSKQSVSNIPCFISMPSEYFPTAFTPNGDGLNDVFKYYGNDILAIELQVFDRWGDIVYESNDVDFMWDGSNKENGYECKLGNYVVKYIIYGLDGSVIKNSSSLMLLR
ncbi:MAG: gliding motility-associated C-terminal domain-containing protein [Flavobacteriales bacterium]|nr:gliding motility-associated C-terminal domain-containing protein [Flavobacteriales bacterium]